MRLFIGVNFDNNVKNIIYSVQQIVQNKAKKGNFTLIDNFHLTIKFLGELDNDMVPFLINAINQTTKHFNNFTITIYGIDSFKPKNEIVYLRVEPNDVLNELYRILTCKLNKMIKQNDSFYTPHLTVGRKILIDNFDNLKESTLINFKIVIDNLTLFESKRIDGKLTYLPLYTKKLN